MSSISEQILAALADFPDGEADISEIRKLVYRRVSTPRDLAARMRQATDRAAQNRSVPVETATLSIFSNRFIERPRRGVWRITPEGRQLVSDMRWLDAQSQTGEKPATDRKEQQLARLASGEADEKDTGT